MVHAIVCTKQNTEKGTVYYKPYFRSRFDTESQKIGIII